MRKTPTWLSDLFRPESFQNLDISLVAESLNDPGVRAKWLSSVIEMIADVNLEADRRLLSGQPLIDLSAKRRAYQDVLEAVLSARKSSARPERHNPKGPVVVDLDKRTAQGVN